MLIVGIDWSKSKHDVALMEPDGSVLQYLVVEHSLEGLEALAHAIGRHESDRGEVGIAVEQYDGALRCLAREDHLPDVVGPKTV